MSRTFFRTSLSPVQGFAAEVHDGQGHHVAHLRNDIDLSREFRRRIEITESVSTSPE